MSAYYPEIHDSRDRGISGISKSAARKVNQLNMGHRPNSPISNNFA